MGIAASIKRAATKATLNQVLGMLDSSDANLLRMVKLIQAISPLDWYDKGLSQVERLIEQGHPGVEAVRRAVRLMSKATRKKFVENMVMNTLMEGHHKRKDFYDEEGFGPPTVLLISPTNICNLKCYGCYAEGHDVHKSLSFETLDKLLTEAKAVGTNWVHFVGGEPFIHPDLMRVFEAHQDMHFNVFTNATLLDDAKIQQLADWGHVSISVSVEGLSEETDERRGRGVYKVATDVMKKLSSKGLIVAFSATYSKRNVETVASDAFIDAMLEAGCVFGWYFMLMPVGSCAVPQLTITPFEKLMFKDRVQRIRDTKPITLFDFGNDEWVTGGCMASKKFVHINSSGGVEPCMFTQYAVDNIHGKSYRDVLKSPFMARLRNDERIRKDPKKTCLVTEVPEVFREIVAESGATDQSGGGLVTTMAPLVDEFARENRKLGSEPASVVKSPEAH